MADKERRFPWFVLTGDALLLLCAMMGLTSSFLTLYGSPGFGWADSMAKDYGWSPTAILSRCAADLDLFLLYSALFALIALAVWSLPRFRSAAAGTLTAVWAAVLAYRWDEAVQGAGIVVREITTLFSSRVVWGNAFEYETGLLWPQEAACARVFLLLALSGLALLAGWAVVRAKRWWFVLLITLPPLLPGLLADLYPNWLGFMALAACWCVMIITSLCRWAAPSGRGKLTLAVFPAVAAVLLFITALFPQEGYTRPAWARKAEEQLLNFSSHMSDYFSKWDGPFRSTVTFVGAAEEADLTNAGPLNYIGRTVLRMKSDYDGWLFLRGSSLGVYEDGVWKSLPEGTYSFASNNITCPLYFPSTLDQSSPTYNITIDNVGAVGACVYTPYFLEPQDVDETGMLPVEDSYMARKQGQWVHSMTFVGRTPPETGVMVDDSSGLHIELTGRYAVPNAAADIERYAGFAYEHYLDVPEGLRDRLNEICWMIGTPYYSGGAVYAAEIVAQYLDTLCEYDASAPAAPDGKDPVLYFLNESRRGYCMHYASAATLILRTMGIPARYVSGFAAQSVAGKQVDVPDRAAHAWVEVWVDGFGWYPVEVTPAAAFEWARQPDVADTSNPPDEAPSIPMPGELETPEPTAAPAPSESVPGAEDDTPGGKEDGPAQPWVMPEWLKGLLWTAAAAGLLWLAQLGVKRLRAKRMAGPDANQSALVCYGYLRRLERWGGKMDERAVELAQKARFSQHTLTEEELALLRGLVDRERTRLCVTPGWAKRLVFRCLWGMPKTPVSLKDETPPDTFS